ncbi:MAG: DinB family protein [Chloroflexota bacterium]|nr:DinB family protein [Chloroflexota bacterium]MDQ5864394.1 DinB family protein [Chloroflexota bacterium]
MASEGVAQLLYLMDAAFDGTDWHSLLCNVRSVRDEDWQWVPPGGNRSIRDIVQHVGGSKLMYQDHAFGGAALTWDHPLVDGGEALATVASAIAWLQEAQERLRESVASLDDAELLRPRMTNWGELQETRWIVAVMVQHDLYHAGEINHIRCLRQENDRWAYEAG